jgi:ABC-type transport system substrate-binding protein
MTRVRASVFIFAAVAAVAAACSGDARRNVPGMVDDVRIGTFTGLGRRIADMLTTEPLVAVRWDGRAVERVAESVVLSEDGSRLSVNLRGDVKLHSGEILEARRVRELLSTKKTFMQQVSSIEVEDARRLIIHAKRRFALKPGDLSEAPVDDDDRLQLRTGPFKIVSTGPPWVLEPFEDYFQGEAQPRRVQIDEYPNHRAAWSAMLRGDVNFLHEVNRDSIEFIEAGGNVQAYPLLRPYVVPLVFNLKHPVLQKQEVRVAINESIDREEIVRNGMRGHGEPAEGPFWPHHWAYSRGRHAFPFNPEAARLRLDAAGVRVVRTEPSRMPSRLRFTCLLRSNDARFERIALVVQRQLFAVGIDMQLQLLPDKEFFGRIFGGRYDAFIFEMSTGRTLNFPYRFWHSGSPEALSGYTAADGPLDRMKIATSDNDIRGAISDVMRILRNDPPAAFLVTPREVRAADRRFEIPYEPDSDVFGTLWQLRLRQLASAR